MTFWAKLLTVILFVLSIAFAAMSGVVFSKRQDWRLQASRAESEKNQIAKQKDAEIQGLQMKLEARESDVNNLQSQVRDLSNELDTTRREREDLARKLRDQEIANSEMQATLKQNNQALETIMTRNKEVAAENRKLEQENRDFMGRLTQANVLKSELEKKVSELTQELKKTRTQLADATEQLRFNEEIFAELSRRNVEWRNVIHDLQALPDIRAKVLQVDPAAKLVVLNVGRNHGVKKNFTFTIFRDANFVAYVNIFEVGEELSAGHIQVAKRPVQQGDDAWTRLP